MILAGILIILYKLYIADLIITLAIAAYVIWQGVTLLPRTVRLLMGAVPDEVEFDEIVEALRSHEGIDGLHHLHIWNLGEHRRALEAHVVPNDSSLHGFEQVKRTARIMLASRFKIEHATFEACLGGDCSDRLLPHYPGSGPKE